VITNEEVRGGLQEVRRLVAETHWIKGDYWQVRYEEGDGTYEDGAIVQDSKVVGCLVGLARLVGMKRPTYVPKAKIDVGELHMTEFSSRMEQVMRETIAAEFVDGFYDEEDIDEEPIHDISIEGWNDTGSRTKEQVLAMLDRAIERSDG